MIIDFIDQDEVKLLARSVLDVDERIWLTPDDVRNGKDTVVESAISWIQSQDTFVEKKRTYPDIYDFELEQNFPNPFNATTIISYELYKSGDIELAVYNLSGQKVLTLCKGFQTAGVYQTTLNAGSLAAGIYIYQIKLANHIKRRKFLMVK
jgi:hypothetical protein